MRFLLYLPYHIWRVGASVCYYRTMKISKGIGIVAAVMIAAFAAGGVYLWQYGEAPTVPPSALPGFTDESGEKDHAPTVVAKSLSIPWDIAFLPDGSMLVTERSGTVVHVENGETHKVEGVVHTGEAGLLGIALHPDFETNRYVYLYLTTSDGDALENNVVRYVYENDALAFDRVILDDIPASRFHDGGQIEFGPDGYLYVTVGDAGNEAAAADRGQLAGSILRLWDDGSPVAGNPFGNAVYSYGHRNPQGLAWDDEGRLYATEHGRSGIRSGFDEINRIERAGNYGWPESEGDTVASGTIGPLLHSTASDTWAPASAAYHDGSLYFGGLRGEALYEAVFKDGEVTELKEHFKGEYGRIRAVQIGPDGFLYFSTSNRDGRGSARDVDDRIVRVHPEAI